MWCMPRHESLNAYAAEYDETVTPPQNGSVTLASQPGPGSRLVNDSEPPWPSTICLARTSRD